MRIGGRAVRTAFAAAAFLTTKTLDEKVTGSKIETIRPQRNYADVPISKKVVIEILFEMEQSLTAVKSASTRSFRLFCLSSIYCGELKDDVVSNELSRW